jgi:hypothetical protein
MTERFTKIVKGDRIDANGIIVDYAVRDVKTDALYADIKFQLDPVKEAGVNGIFIEDLLNICLDRLEQYQKTKFKCVENSKSIRYIRNILVELDNRTKNRQKRNVEGTSQR